MAIDLRSCDAECECTTIVVAAAGRGTGAASAARARAHGGDSARPYGGRLQDPGRQNSACLLVG
jgi:hypothetical protein